MIKITDKLLEEVSDRAKVFKRKRSNYKFHKSTKDPMQRFLNAVEPGTYVRPHKHDNPPKTEVFIVLKGKVLVLEFGSDGKVTDHVILDSRGWKHRGRDPANGVAHIHGVARRVCVVRGKGGAIYPGNR
jgi:cupin fold WbuC family metalloprotein